VTHGQTLREARPSVRRSGQHQRRKHAPTEGNALEPLRPFRGAHRAAVGFEPPLRLLQLADDRVEIPANIGMWPISEVAGRLIDFRLARHNGWDLLTLSSSRLAKAEHRHVAVGTRAGYCPYLTPVP
jgi:hypothetical protein